MSVPANYFSADYTKISLASAEISVFGQTIRGITKLTLEENVKRDPAYGNSPFGQGLPVGQHSATGTIGMFTASAAALRQVIGGGWSQGSIGIAMSFYEPLGVGLIQYNISRASIVKLALDVGDSGNKSSEETFDLVILDPIDWDGIPAIYRASDTGGIAIQLPTISLF